MKKDDFWRLIGRGRRHGRGLSDYADSAEVVRVQSRPAPHAGVRRILRATHPAAGPHSRDEGCWLCCAGWAGLAMLARMSWAGWAGQVRLVGLAFILSPLCLVVVSFVFF